MSGEGKHQHHLYCLTYPHFVGLSFLLAVVAVAAMLWLLYSISTEHARWAESTDDGSRDECVGVPVVASAADDLYARRVVVDGAKGDGKRGDGGVGQ